MPADYPIFRDTAEVLEHHPDNVGAVTRASKVFTALFRRPEPARRRDLSRLDRENRCAFAL